MRHRHLKKVHLTNKRRSKCIKSQKPTCSTKRSNSLFFWQNDEKEFNEINNFNQNWWYCSWTILLISVHEYVYMYQKYSRIYLMSSVFFVFFLFVTYAKAINVCYFVSYKLLAFVVIVSYIIGLNVSLEATEFDKELESLNGIGSLSVTKDGDCANFDLAVTFLTLPGDQEEMTVGVCKEKIILVDRTCQNA